MGLMVWRLEAFVLADLGLFNSWLGDPEISISEDAAAGILRQDSGMIQVRL